MSPEANKPISHNERETEQRIKEIYENFDFKIFREVVDDFKKKIGAGQQTQEQRKTSENFSIPTFEFNRNLIVIACINPIVNLHGHIKFNPKEISKLIPEMAKRFRKMNIKVDFDLVYLLTVKVLIHELLHKEGSLEDNSVTGEAILEIISYIIMHDYLTRAGNRTSKQLDQILGHVANFGFYKVEIFFLIELLSLTSKYLNIDIYVLRKALFLSFFNRESHIVTHWFQLPDQIRGLWRQFRRFKQIETYYFTEKDYVKQVLDLLKKIEDVKNEH